MPDSDSVRIALSSRCRGIVLITLRQTSLNLHQRPSQDRPIPLLNCPPNHPGVHFGRPAGSAQRHLHSERSPVSRGGAICANYPTNVRVVLRLPPAASSLRLVKYVPSASVQRLSATIRASEGGDPRCPVDEMTNPMQLSCNLGKVRGAERGWLGIAAEQVCHFGRRSLLVLWT